MLSDSLAAKVKGNYSGHSGKNLVTLVINYIVGKTVSGYDVHQGIRRNLNGEVVPEGNLLNFVLKEPGTRPGDGSYIFSLDTVNFSSTGTFVPQDTAKFHVSKIALQREKPGFDDGVYAEYWHANEDSTLIFHLDGTCSFEFYPHTAIAPDTTALKKDSTGRSYDDAVSSDDLDQLVTIRGNFEKKGMVYHIEWEKSPYLHDLKWTMERKDIKDGKDSTILPFPTLIGQGLTFHQELEED